jgi:hypothetical protein
MPRSLFLDLVVKEQEEGGAVKHHFLCPMSQASSDSTAPGQVPGPESSLDTEAKARRDEFIRRNREARAKMTSSTRKEKAKHAKLRSEVGGLVDQWREEHMEMLKQQQEEGTRKDSQQPQQ